MSGNKDIRSSNFSKEEINKLMMLLKDYPVITCKKTDHSSNKQKDAAWKLLADKFNSDATIYRNVKQLQQKYNNMKKTARKEMAEEKYGRRLTGGGPPPSKPSETTEWLNTIMKESISGLTAVYDSDALDSTIVEDLNTQDTSSSAKVNLDFLDASSIIIPENSFPHDNLDQNETVLVEPNELPKKIATNSDAAEIKAFDASTPKSMLRKPVSKELVNPARKRNSAYTPLETRKQIISNTI